MAEARTRSIRISNLPPATQEGLLQQMLEKIVPVSRVEVFIDKQEAIVELKTPAVSPAIPTRLWYDADVFLTGCRTVVVKDGTNYFWRKCADAG